MMENNSVQTKDCELVHTDLVNLELDAQELEDMEAPGWDVVASAVISLVGGISLSVAIT